jgi:hypothetical protein
MPTLEFFPASEESVSQNPWENGLAKQVLTMYADLALLRLQEEGVSLNTDAQDVIRTQAIDDAYQDLLVNEEVQPASTAASIVSPELGHTLKVAVEQRILQLLPSPQESWEKPKPVMHRDMPLMPFVAVFLMLLSMAVITTAFAK